VNGVPTPTWDAFIEVRLGCSGSFVARLFRDGVELEVEVALRQGPFPSPLEALAEMSSSEDDRPAAKCHGEPATQPSCQWLGRYR
jgi:hypothetical protein